MPIVEFQLPRDSYSDEQIGRLLLAASASYAEILQSPLERVRAFAQLLDPQHVAVGGKLLCSGGTPAPYFRCLVLAGRPVEQSQALLAAFTDHCVEILGAERALVRGACWPIPAEYWAIGGTPASILRKAELAARAGGR